MCKSKQIPPVDTFTEDIYQKKDCVRTVSYIIIAFCIILLLGLLGLMVYRASMNNPEVYRVIATSDICPDSLRTYSYVSYEQMDSLINAVVNYDAQLTQKYQYLVEQKEQDSQVFYWGSLIVGLVIAVFGWFGFQSFTTIEDKAKGIAHKTARSASNSFLKKEGKKLVQDSAKKVQKDAVKKVKGQVLNDLNSIIEERLDLQRTNGSISELEKRIEFLESKVFVEIDKTIKETINEVFEKYRRPINDDLKKKEEK